jgi:hypothetical protein
MNTDEEYLFSGISRELFCDGSCRPLPSRAASRLGSGNRLMHNENNIEVVSALSELRDEHVEWT